MSDIDKSKVDSILKTWNPDAFSANKELLGQIRDLYAKSRNLQNSNGLANSIINKMTDKVVGPGFKLIPQVDYKVLGWDVKKAKKWNDKAESLWNLYSNSKDFDLAGKNNFAESTRLALRTILMNGDVIGLVHWDKDANGMFKTKIQLVECDRLITPPHLEDNKNIRAGIEYDKQNRPIAYYISKEYPEDDTYNENVNYERVPAKTKWGRTRVIHVYKQDRIDQSRGKPIFSTVLTLFKKLDLYEEAELSAAVVSAMIALIIESPPKSDKELMEQFGIRDEDHELLEEVRRGWNRNMEAGGVVNLYHGEKAQTFSPNRPNSSFSAFVENITRTVGIGSAGLSYETIMNDFSKCNYSSARAVIQEDWERILSFRTWFNIEWVKELYSLHIEECINTGKLEAPDFYENKEAYLKYRLHGPTKGVLDPVKEAKAAIMLVDAGLSSRTQESARLGSNWEDTADELEREQDVIETKHLKLASNGQLVEINENEKEESND
tara:strand:- start:9300 stop:10781 length:1482 start_codon:yes stop_codon:yes gene_type:complete